MSGDDHNQGEARRGVHLHSEPPWSCTHIGEHCCVDCCEPGGVHGEVSS